MSKDISHTPNPSMLDMAYTVPSAGIAASIVTSTTSMGVAFENCFHRSPNSTHTLFGGRPYQSKGGGGGARSKVFHQTALIGCVDENGEAVKVDHVQYALIDYRSSNNLGLPLPEGYIACRMHYSLVLGKFNALELKHLCVLHNLEVPRKPTRDVYLALLAAHQCDGCEVSYAILSPVLSPPKGLFSVTSAEFASSIKKFPVDRMKGIVADDVLAGIQGGFVVASVLTDANATIDDLAVPLVEIPLHVLIPQLSIAGLKTLAFHHGLHMPSRGSKQSFVDAMRLHQCTDCVPLLFHLQPLKVTKPSTQNQNRKPSWVEDIDRDDRSPFIWEAYVNIDTEPWPPRPTTMRDVAAAMTGYCKELEPSAVEEDGCTVCGQLTTRPRLIPAADLGAALDILVEEGVSVPERRCPGDPPHHLGDVPVLAPRLSHICDSCHDSLNKGTRPKMALANSLWLGEVPDVLKDLTLAEQALISRVRYNRVVVRVSSGHAKMIANVISFEHPSMKIYERLPPAREDLDDILAVVFTGVVKPNEDDMRRTPVLVRRNHVKRALEWLKLNHKNYADLEIDYTALNTYALEDVPIGVWHKHVTEEDGTTPASAKSVFDNDDELGTTEGPCPFTVHGLTTEKFSTMSSTERKLAAVQHLKNGGKFLAVGHAEQPQSIWDNPDLYPQMFPWLFPYGFGGLGQVSHKGVISKENHLKWLLLYHDKRFQRDAGFLIVAFNHQLIKQNSRGTFMMCKRNNFGKVANSIRAIHPEVLSSIVQRLQSGARVTPVTEEEKRAFCLLDQVDVVGTNVNGSLASKKHQRNEIWSLVNFMGTPNWFVTLSPADNKHPLCIYWASEDIEFRPTIRTSAERLHLVTRNPVACARFFDYVVRLFIVHILGWDDDDVRHGIFGKLSAYYGSVEQQGRMTLHLHILIWIANTLSPQAIRDRLMSGDGEFERRLVDYIESCQVGEFLTGTKDEVAARVPHIPDLKLRGIHTILEDKSDMRVADDYQNPTLTLPEAPPTEYCKNVLHCDCPNCRDLEAWYDRFKFSVDDIVLRSNVHKCFGRKDNKSKGAENGNPSAAVPQRHATGKGCINQDGICTARFPREVFLKTFVDLQTGQLFMKKLESSINTITPVVTRCFLCNTDTTSLMSGTAVKAIIGYVTDYVTKGWLKTHQIFSTMYDAFTRDSHQGDEELKPAQAARKMVLRVVNSLSAKMEIGAPMAALYLLQNPDHYTSHDFVVFYWKNFMNQVQKDWQTALENNDGLHTTDPMSDETLEMGINRTSDGVPVDISLVMEKEDDNLVIGRSAGNFVGKSNTDDYIYRPLELQDVPLYEWIQCSIRMSSSSARAPPADLHFFRYMPEHPMAESHRVACDPSRRHYIVPNFLGPVLPRKDVGSREDYCCAMLTLFKPWRSGLDLKGSDTTWETAFEEFPFTDRQRQLIDNFNLRYECYDARDDFGSTFKAATATGDEDDVELDPDVDGEGVFEDHEFDVGIEGDDSQIQNEIDIPGKDCEADRKKYADTLAAIKRAGWSAWEQTCKFTVHLPRLAIDRSLGAAAWRHLIKVEKQRHKDKRLKALDDMLTFDDDGGGNGKVKNNAIVVAGDYLSKDFVPTDVVWSTVMDDIVRAESLNTEQEKAFRIVANHATCVAPDQLLMHLGGMGGTGKSTVIKALIKYFVKRKEPYRFVLLGPTGTSAALIGGSTYHSFLGLRSGTNAMGGESLTAIEELKQRVIGVSYIFLDEMSMLSCKDLCRISAKCCDAREHYEQPFGGLNVILAGDFAQLPPAKGKTLYDNRVSLQQSPRQSTGEQENTIGKIVWLQFTTVVILKENMRQIGNSPQEKAFQTALNNLRYFACTDEDVNVLRTRVAGSNSSASLADPRFRNVSIITARNLAKDQLNESNTERFARESGQKIHDFYSVDSLTNSPPKRDSAVNGKRKVFIDTKVITRQMQTSMWSQMPHTSDQIPASLRLCMGLPVLICNNEVTELCMTKGQEARVVAWTASPIPHWENKKALDVLYLELTNPPHNVKLPHLPQNIVPLTRISQVVDARLPCDKFLHISRSQIPVLPNFAMTDYSSQGKTWTYNVVDISECRNFQAVYTCLSRGKTLEGTLILQDFTAKDVRGALHGALRQEFRELNYLDIITDLRYKGELPPTVIQSTRWETIDRYRRWKVSHEESEWHPALSGTRPEDSVPLPQIYSQVETFASQNKRKLQSDAAKDDRQPKKRRTVTRRAANFLPPVGPIWDARDWSCPYDALTFLLYTLWKSDLRKWTSAYQQYGMIMNEMLTGFRDMVPTADALEQLTAVRDAWRSITRTLHSGEYPTGQRGTDIYSLCRDLLNFKMTCPGASTICAACGNRAGRRLLAAHPVGRYTALHDEMSVQDCVGNRRRGLTECKRCGDIQELGYDQSDLLCFEAPHDSHDVLYNSHIDIESWGTYRLAGVIYFGAYHFVARAVQEDGKVYFHDGAIGGYSTHEGSQGVTFPITGYNQCGEKRACVVLYAKAAGPLQFSQD